jgi:hypothetical protein
MSRILYHVPSQGSGRPSPARQNDPKAKAFLPSTMQPLPHPGTEAVHAAHTRYKGGALSPKRSLGLHIHLLPDQVGHLNPVL